MFLFLHNITNDFGRMMILRGLGFNLFSIVNNHAFDYGEEGFKKTKSTFGEDSFGAGTYNEDYKVKVTEIKGVNIEILLIMVPMV